MMVHIYKTSVSNKRGVKAIKPLLNALIPNSKWNFDLHDCDNILRIDCKEITSDKVIEVLKSQGFDCLELE